MDEAAAVSHPGQVLRGIAVAAVSLVLAAPAAAAVSAETRAGAASAVASDAVERDVLGAVNAFRAQHGLAPLRLSRQLSAAADVQSEAMAQRGFFAHRS